jgi:uncharacterized RDD family membrane protein YckC
MSHRFQTGYAATLLSTETAAYSGCHGPCRHRYARRVNTPGPERGTRLGLPPAGPQSLAPLGPRIAAFALDSLLSFLVAGLFTAPQLPRLWSLLAFVCAYVFFAATFGQTPGMALLRLGLARVDSGEPVRAGIGRVALRTVLLILLVPAVLVDADGRGLHDRVTGTAVIRLR